TRVEALDVGEANIQEFGDGKTYQIRLPRPDGPQSQASAITDKVRGMLQAQYPGVTVGAAEAVSGKVSDELAKAGLLAITLAMLGVAVYIWFRFEWQFGVGALVTLFHDVALILGFFALTQLQVDLNIVAAFLAVVGYSLNDTVVIYDRIRENMRKFRKMQTVQLLNL
ncbi:protein translocase subunit SecF, partial [Pseudomonas sp. 30_B]|uniref:protein translocase subunit SecF n=1 Tax=Pseudomonas sp. 30_B TaxID=2813575 RepID=UPI001A9E9ED8